MKERNERLVKRAHMKYMNVSMEDILYTPERCLDRNMIPNSRLCKTQEVTSYCLITNSRDNN